MKRATKANKSAIVEILALSFEINASVNYVVKNDRHRSQRIRKLMEYSFDTCFEFGDVFISDDGNGCALVLYPDKKRNSLKAVLRDIWLVRSTIGIANVKKVLARQALVKKHHPIEGNFCHGWYLAVHPEHRKTGHGLSFIRELIREGDALKLNIFIETATIRNLPLYQFFGFEIFDTVKMDHTLYFLKRGCK